MEVKLLLAKGDIKRIHPSQGHWPVLEKELVALFADRRQIGRVVWHKWFERNAKILFSKLYPQSNSVFCFSPGWFRNFLSRNNISLRIITNQVQETPIEYLDTIINFLCFNRRNSQLRDGTQDQVRGILEIGRYICANIVNMDQTPLPWEYLEGRTYEFKGNKTVWVRSRKSGWGKRQATIQLTIFADGVARVRPLIIFRGAEESSRAARKKEQIRYDKHVVVKFNKKAYANAGEYSFIRYYYLLY